jgi:hypothetical protein
MGPQIHSPGMRIRALPLPLLAAVGVLMLSGCGADEGAIPSGDGELLMQKTDELKAQVDAEECDEANATLTEIRQASLELPDDVDPEIVSSLDRLISRIDEQLDEQCVEEEEEITTTETTTEPVVPTTTAEPTTTEPTTTEEDTDPDPPGQGGTPPGQGGTPPGQGGGGSGGGGSGGGGSGGTGGTPSEEDN